MLLAKKIFSIRATNAQSCRLLRQRDNEKRRNFYERQTALRRFAPACMLTATGCAAKSASVKDLMKDTKKEQTESLYDTSVVQDTATALTGFGTALLQNAMVEANPLVSPLSVASALSMTANGAAGETKTQMEQTLGADTGSLNAYFPFCKHI